MFWFFERQQNRLHYEIRREDAGPAYELVITYPDGSREIERFADPVALVQRSLSLQHALREEGWRPPVAHPRHGRRT